MQDPQPKLSKAVKKSQLSQMAMNDTFPRFGIQSKNIDKWSWLVTLWTLWSHQTSQIQTFTTSTLLFKKSLKRFLNNKDNVSSLSLSLSFVSVSVSVSLSLSLLFLFFSLFASTHENRKEEKKRRHATPHNTTQHNTTPHPPYRKEQKTKLR